MEIDTTTLILELINFAILVWILHRLLFHPIRSILEERKERLQGIADQAQSQLRESEQLRTQYTQQLKDWDDEVSKLHGELHSELAQLKAQGLEEIRVAVQKEEERLTAARDRAQQEALNEVEKLGVSRAARFIRKFLERLSGVELDIKLLHLMFDDLENPSDLHKARLVEVRSEHPSEILVKTAHALPQSEREFVSAKCQSLLQSTIRPSFLVDPSLISGARVSVGAWELRADIQAELGFFFQGLDKPVID